MSQQARPNAEARQALLERAAQAEGSAWADWWRGELRRQHRAFAGGWPGTLSEARVRVARRIATELGAVFEASRVEIEVAARTAYGAARRAWNQTCERDDCD